MSEPRIAEAAAQQGYRFGAFEFNALHLELRRHGEVVEVEPKPLEVLLELLRHAGELVTKEELIESVWGGRIVTDYVITRCINKLRVALQDTAQRLILSIYGRGYRFTAPVLPIESATVAESEVFLRPEQPVPHRPHWHLEKALDEARGVWLAVQPKTMEHRVFKFALVPDRIPALKRELTFLRTLKASLGERDDFVRLLDFNLEMPPYFLELDWCTHGNLADWLGAQGGVSAVPLAQRLQLIAEAAESLAIAHAAGVLHLDVKPSNLLIWTGQDDCPHTRWTDFGCSRLVDPERLCELGITRMGTRTEAGTDSGTLMYMAPEVIAGRSPTALSDIYALGVMLYQIVVGNLLRPLAPGWEKDVDDELLREDIAAAAAGDPGERIGSASELARRLRKLGERQRERALERQRAGDALALGRRLEQVRARRPWLIAACLALATGLFTSLAFYRSAAVARDDAQTEAARAEAVTSFLNNDVLGAISPYRSGNSHELTVREALDQAANTLDQRFAGQPLTEAEVRFTIATLYTQMDRIPEAEQQARKSRALFEATLGPDNSKTLNADNLLGLDLIGESRFAEAFNVLSEMRETIRNERHPDPAALNALNALENTYARFEQRYADLKAGTSRWLSRDPAPANAPSPLRVLLRSRLALAEAHLGQFDLAEAEDQQISIELGKFEHDDGSLSALMREEQGIRMYLMGRYESAAKTLAAAHSDLLRILGPDDQATAESLEYLGLAMLRQGQAAGGEEHCREAYEAMLKHYGPENYFTLMAEGHLGITEFATQRPDGARRNLIHASEHLERLLGWKSPSVQYFRFNLAVNASSDAAAAYKAAFEPEVIRQESPAEDWSHLLATL